MTGRWMKGRERPEENCTSFFPGVCSLFARDAVCRHALPGAAFLHGVAVLFAIPAVALGARHLSVGPFGFLRRSRLRLFHHHFCAGRELQLATGYDRFARLNTFLDYGEIALFLSGCDLSQVEGGILFHHKNVGTILANLDRAVWDQLCIFDDVENQADVDKLRRPERCGPGWA